MERCQRFALIVFMKRLLLIAMVAAFVVVPISATRPIMPPTQAEMAHAWFGYDNYRSFVRLNLKADGKGTVAWLQLGAETPTVFDILKWEWNPEKWKLDLSVRPRRLDYRDVWLRIENAGWDEVAISFGNKREKWERKATLMNEPAVLDRLKAATVE